ncbi:lipoprotein-releasing system ATP-binding protein [Balneicella halophila]|uniref:Lipoprotein-releasing system ATP-binding protein n=1 Tax=Balneicella halophila TaxID=1537566 RepID=A0A7L4UPN8_BALHA|nr:ABC transporter ATP-binding protein [Balneicella halophila]PVX51738.1 lipoprotein-releasing system ATP-binding protein [Balneicella halophila]
MLTATNITKSYDQLQVLKDVSLEINAKEVVAIVGASGAGKTTLLQILSTLDKADGGNLLFNGEDISKYGEKRLAKFRNKEIGFIFQFHHLLPEFTALENVCIPAYILGKGRKESEERALELLTILGLKDRINHKPSELSGGENQRVAVARAMMNNPAIIFADEPTGNLDSANKEEIHQLFFDLRDKLGQTFVIVTHDSDFADQCDRKLVMKDGRIINE